MGLLYNLQKHVFSFIGDIKWGGITHPFWFTINATGYKLKGEHYRKLSKKLKPGDVVIRRFEGYIDKWFIPKMTWMARPNCIQQGKGCPKCLLKK